MSDQLVSSRAVLDAVMELRRIGGRRSLEQLEQVEPELASYLMETLTMIHGQIVDLGGPAQATQRVYHRMQSLTLVCIAALRRAHYELWRDTDAGRQFDPTIAPDDEPPPSAEPDTE